MATNAQRAGTKAGAYLDIAAQAIQKAHQALVDPEVLGELGKAGRSVVERVRVLRNDANALSIDVMLVERP